MKALIIYVPALHKGYVDFFRKNPDARIFLLDLSLVREVPRMERDIRALKTRDIFNALKGVGFLNIAILNKKNLKEIEKASEIIMPDEDVSRNFAKNHLKGRKKIKFIECFLRWNKQNSKKKNIVGSIGKISREDFDNKIMKKAFAEARKSPDWWRQIGAIIVKNRRIIMASFNKPLPCDQAHNIFGDPRSNFDYGVSFDLSKFIHAEASLIAEAAKRGVSLEKTSLYVTTFPCPVCAKLVAKSGIKKVYYSEGYSLLDAQDILKSFNIEIVKVED